MVESAVLSEDGRVRLPGHVKRGLNLRTGDEVFFLKENGRFWLTRDPSHHLPAERGEVQDSSDGEILSRAREIRKEIWKQKHQKDEGGGNEGS